MVVKGWCHGPCVVVTDCGDLYINSRINITNMRTVFKRNKCSKNMSEVSPGALSFQSFTVVLLFSLSFQYLRGLQKLGEVMKMDRISLDLGLDMTLDALISRAEQLTRLEADALADRSTHVYNLQRKVRTEWAGGTTDLVGLCRSLTLVSNKMYTRTVDRDLPYP